MTVEQLITFLQRYDPQTPVVVDEGSGDFLAVINVYLYQNTNVVVIEAEVS